jgi:glycosyltransferase involved in cell wall biosynthesis
VSEEGAGLGNHAVVIIPCFNEGGRIGEVVRSIRGSYPGLDVVVVNDDSSDSSAAEARMAGAVVLTHGCNLGYGAALETGYRFALEAGCEYAIQMDGDGQHPASEVAALRSAVERGADVVIGSRYGRRGATAAASPMRRAGHSVFSLAIRALTGLRLSDPTSGFQALSRKAMELFTSGVFPCDYPDSDVILMSRMAGLAVAEIPVEMKPRSGGKSMHSGLKPLYYVAKMLLSMLMVLLNFRTWHRWKGRFKTAGTATGGTRSCF